MELNRAPYDAEVRWRACVSQTETYLGSVLGHHYVSNNFPDSSSFAAIEVEKDIERAFIGFPTWMDQNITGSAKEKLNSLSTKIGLPTKWNVYNGLVMEPGKFFEVAMNARKLSVQDSINQIGKSVDHATWDTLPQAIDIYYRYAHTSNWPSSKCALM